MSRSGGTLLVTILDAHPQLAMSYELYPDLLVGRRQTGESAGTRAANREDAEPAPLDLREVERLLTNRPHRTFQLLRDEGFDDTRTFLARAMRSGLDQRKLRRLLRSHIERTAILDNATERLRFVERVCRTKMSLEGKGRWGAKCSGQFEAYLALWPNARFINIIRDGRDVLASQMNTGHFNPSPVEVGRCWAKTHQRFRALMARDDVHALEVSYERLTMQPRTEIERICDFTGLDFDEKLLTFNRRRLTIYRNSRGHLSRERISQPIDATKIGRWRNDLKAVDVDQFMSTAATEMRHYGYIER